MLSAVVYQSKCHGVSRGPSSIAAAQTERPPCRAHIACFLLTRRSPAVLRARVAYIFIADKAAQQLNKGIVPRVRANVTVSSCTK